MPKYAKEFLNENNLFTTGVINYDMAYNFKLKDFYEGTNKNNIPAEISSLSCDIYKSILTLDILKHDNPTFIKSLCDLTGVNVSDIPFDDTKTLSIFSSLNALKIKPEDINGISVGTLGVPEFGHQFHIGMLEEIRPETLGELVRVLGLGLSIDTWHGNAQDILKSGTAKLSEVISVRDDIINYLLEHGMTLEISYSIMDSVNKGKGSKKEIVEEMLKYNIPQWYIDSCNKIKYMFPKAHIVGCTMMVFRIAYFKVHYPLAFYSAYFSLKGLSPYFASAVLKGREHILDLMNDKPVKEEDDDAKENNFITLGILLEALARGFKFYPASNESHPTKFMINNNDGLLCPLSSVQV